MTDPLAISAVDDMKFPFELGWGNNPSLAGRIVSLGIPTWFDQCHRIPVGDVEFLLQLPEDDVTFLFSQAGSHVQVKPGAPLLLSTPKVWKARIFLETSGGFCSGTIRGARAALPANRLQRSIFPQAPSAAACIES